MHTRQLTTIHTRQLPQYTRPTNNNYTQHNLKLATIHRRQIRIEWAFPYRRFFPVFKGQIFMSSRQFSTKLSSSYAFLYRVVFSMVFRRIGEMYCLRRVKRENQQDATNLMFIIKLLSQHVSGIIMPIVRRTRVCTAAYGVLHW